MAVFHGPSVSADAIYDVDRIKLFAETIGIAGGSSEEKITHQAYNLLAEELTEIMKKIIIDANKYQIHGRHSMMKVADLEQACIDRTIKLPMGYVLHEEKELRAITNSSGSDLYVHEESDIEINQVLQSTSKFPPPVRFRCHWLAHEGEIHPVSENLVPYKDVSIEVEDQKPAKKIIARRDTAKILQGNGPWSLYCTLSRDIPHQENVAIRPLPPASLSVEKQAYLKSVMEACVGAHDPLRVAALHSLETDTGLQDALPILSNIIKTGIAANVVQRCLSLLIYLVRVIRSLSLNKSLVLEPVLHQLLPSLLTCCIGQSLCGRPETDNHWALRDFASKTLVILVNGHVKDLPSTRQRVIRSLRRVFEDKNCSYAMIYGTVLPLSDLMSAKEKAELYPRFNELIEECRLISSGQQIDPHELRFMPGSREEAGRLLSVLMKQMEPMMRSMRPGIITYPVEHTRRMNIF
ncbi:unnamed protein product, partial [Mesorhabditis belari]|uniref:Transcription initiation factor TFIID subunit 6 n=1 Tax=Mesorhabditis belari TaxID=2138241 RepID=A0AAF3EYV7_9BILA